MLKSWYLSFRKEMSRFLIRLDQCMYVDRFWINRQKTFLPYNLIFKPKTIPHMDSCKRVTEWRILI